MKARAALCRHKIITNDFTDRENSTDYDLLYIQRSGLFLKLMLTVVCQYLNTYGRVYRLDASLSEHPC